MKKNVQINMDEATYIAVKLSARTRGLTVTAYMRMLAVVDAANTGYHTSPPSPD